MPRLHPALEIVIVLVKIPRGKVAEQNYEVWKVRKGTEGELGSGPVGHGLKPNAERQAETCNNALGEKEKKDVDYKVFLDGSPHRFRMG